MGLSIPKEKADPRPDPRKGEGIHDTNYRPRRKRRGQEFLAQIQEKTT